jgi:hypothetical protein
MKHKMDEPLDGLFIVRFSLPHGPCLSLTSSFLTREKTMSNREEGKGQDLKA